MAAMRKKILVESFNYFCEVKGYVPIIEESANEFCNSDVEPQLENTAILTMFCESDKVSNASVYNATIRIRKESSGRYRQVILDTNPKVVWECLYFAVRI